MGGFFRDLARDTIRYGKDVILTIEGNYWGKIAKTNPQKHALHEMKREKQELIRPINIQDPVYFQEKMMWLKYYSYNNQPVVAQCYNKYEVRDYVKSKGLERILNDLYGVWDSIDEIPWDDLPEEYVMKVTNGCQGHVYKIKGVPLDRKEAIRTLRNSERRSSYFFKITGDLFCYGTKQKIICERLLYSNLGFNMPEDYKFHCFNGEPMFLEYMTDRVEHTFSSRLVNMDLKDRHDLDGTASPGDMEEPPCFEEMKELARILSDGFPYIRVDFYVDKDRPIFGEMTFTPYNRQTPTSQTELGELLDISEEMRKTGYRK